MLRDTTAATWGQPLFPGQCGWRWVLFPAPLSRTRSFQRAGMGEFKCGWPEGSVFPAQTRRDIVCVCCPQWHGEGVVPLNGVQGSQMIPVRHFSLNPHGKGGLNLTGGSVEPPRVSWTPSPTSMLLPQKQTSRPHSWPWGTRTGKDPSKVLCCRALVWQGAHVRMS